MRIGIGLNISQRSGGGASDAIASALSTRAGMSWQPWNYATTMFTDTAATVPAANPGDIIAVQIDPSRGLTPTGANLAATILGGTSGWTFTGAVTVSGGAIVFTTAPSAAAIAVYNPIVTSGKTYEVIVTSTGTGRFSVRTGSGGDQVADITPGGTNTFLLRAAGGTPTNFTVSSAVSAVNNFVGSITSISIKEVPYNLFRQDTLANRPILVRHPKDGARNILTGSATMATQSRTVTAAQHTLSFKGTGTVTLTGVSTAGPLIGTGVSDTVSLTFTPTAGSLTMTVSGSVTEAQLELGAARTTYQTVSSTGYSITQAGSADCWGLLHDGTNDSMATAATLDLSASDAVVAIVGVRKQSDAARGVILETTASVAANNGGILITGPDAASATYGAESKGTVLATCSGAGLASPNYAALTLIADISADTLTLQRNGSTIASAATDQGTGNYANATVYLGARGGSSVYQNGIDFGGVIVGGLNGTTDAALIAAMLAQISENTPGV